MKNNIYNLFFLLLTFFASISSFAQKITEIQVNGLDRISRGTFLNYLPLETGDEISQELVDNSLKSLYETKMFSKISVDLKNEILVFNVSENPTIKFLDFNNYKDGAVLDEDVINDLKNNLNLRDGQIFVKDNLDRLTDELRNLYQKNAFYKIEISVNSKVDNQNRIEIDVNLDEGEKALIKKFNISGNNTFSKDDITDQFNIGEPDFFLINYFTEKDNFSEVEYQAGLKNITNLYTSKGFLDIKTNKSKVNFDVKNNEIYVDIIIDEGPQYKLGSIIFNGDLKFFTSEYLRKKIKLEENENFNRKEIIKGINAITDLYRDKGFAYTLLDLDAKASKASSNILDVIINIDPSGLVYVNRIEFRGNNKTQDDVLRREMTINEGQSYSKKELDESVNKIKRLGYFSSVNYEMKRHANNPDKVDLIFDLVESKTGEFSIGVSHSNSTGASLNLSVSQKNILGTGNTLKAALRNSDAVKEKSFYFLDPHFNNLGHSISYGFFDKTIDASNLDASAYSISENGINFGYGIPISGDSELSTELRVSSLELTCGDSLRLVDEVIQCADPDNKDITTSFSYVQNSLNDFYFPTEGTQKQMSGLVSLPFSDLKYYQIEGSYRDYSQILDNKTFKTSARIKYASGYGGEKLPFYKRYFEGGQSSVRGFDFNSLGSKYSNGKPKGGEFSLITSTGISTSMDFLGIDNQNMKFITFADAGTIAETVSDISPDEIRSSLGFGVNWLTPVGPLGFHYAYPLVKKNEDVIKTFSFELGASF